MGQTKQTQTQSQKRDPYSPAKPAINQSISGIQQWLSDPASSAAYQGGMSDWTKSGLENLAGSSGAYQSRDYLQDVLSGKYLNADNPWQADLDANIRAAVMPSVNSTFSNAGMAGSTAHQQSLTQGLTSGLAAPRYQNYQAERANQMAAAGLLPGVDNQISQNLLTAGQTSEAYDRARWEEERLAGLRPYLETQGLLQGYGSIGGTSSGTSTSKSTPSLGSQIAGGVMTGVGLMSGMPGVGMAGAGLMGGGMSYGGQGAYAPSYAPGLSWAPDRGLGPWGYTVT